MTHSRSVCITIKCYLFPPFFQRVICSPIVPGFIAIKGTYPKPPPLFVFHTPRACTRKNGRPAYEANHQKYVILSLLVPTSITKMPAPEGNSPWGFAFLRIFLRWNVCFAQSAPSFGFRLKSFALARPLPSSPRDLDLLLLPRTGFAVLLLLRMFFARSRLCPFRQTKFVSRAHW